MMKPPPCALFERETHQKVRERGRERERERETERETEKDRERSQRRRDRPATGKGLHIETSLNTSAPSSHTVSP